MATIRISALILVFAFASANVLAEQSSRLATHERAHHTATQLPLLHRDEGLTILAAALKLRYRLDSAYDCSHLVNAVYRTAGFPYKYATSAQLYVGSNEFRRVFHPQPGDLVVFLDRGKHGHVGIVVNPVEHQFFSGLSHGPGVSSYTSQYWRRRGVPHFFRYIRKAPKTHTALLQ